MNHRAKSPTPGLRPAFASPTQRSAAMGFPIPASPASTASRRSAARDLRPKSAAQSTTLQTFEDVAAEVLERLEILIGQARARIAAHDAAKFKLDLDLAPIPSLTSAFATRCEIFGPVTVEDVDG